MKPKEDIYIITSIDKENPEVYSIGDKCRIVADKGYGNYYVDFNGFEGQEVYESGHWLVGPGHGGSAMEKLNDAVNHPSHYNQGEVECIDAIRSMLGDEGFVAYCRGNAMKYQWRMLYKGKPREDFEKAQWYLKRINDLKGLNKIGGLDE